MHSQPFSDSQYVSLRRSLKGFILLHMPFYDDVAEVWNRCPLLGEVGVWLSNDNWATYLTHTSDYKITFHEPTVQEKIRNVVKYFFISQSPFLPLYCILVCSLNP